MIATNWSSRWKAGTIGCAALLAIATGAAPASAATLRQLTSGQVVSNLPFDTQLEAAKSLGLRRARVGIRIYEVEKAGGRYEWTAADTRVRALVAAGMTPIVTLFGRSRLVERAAPGPDGRVPLTDPEIRAFATFAARAVERYGTSQGGQPVLYEIWNEPNTKTFWGSPPDPEAYARLAEAACRSVREQHPQAAIVGLAMEGSPLNKPYFVKDYGIDIYREWAGRAATPSLMACLDGVSFHPYRREPETYLTDEPGLARFLAERWRKDRPPLVVNSEWGYSVGPKHAATVEQQAALDLRLLLVGTGFGRITNLYQLVDGGRDVSDSRLRYGLFDADGRPKPAGAAVKRLLDAIGDYEIEGVAPVADRPGLFRFTARDGKAGASGRASVLWRASGSGEVRLADLKIATTKTVVDLVSGKAQPAGTDTIAVSESPILILHGGD